MKIEYDCGCIIEYRKVAASACKISSRDNKKRDFYTPGTHSSKKGRPLYSEGELVRESCMGKLIQCTWVTPCPFHYE